VCEVAVADIIWTPILIGLDIYTAVILEYVPENAVKNSIQFCVAYMNL